METRTSFSLIKASVSADHLILTSTPELRNVFYKAGFHLKIYSKLANFLFFNLTFSEDRFFAPLKSVLRKIKKINILSRQDSIGMLIFAKLSINELFSLIWIILVEVKKGKNNYIKEKSAYFIPVVCEDEKGFIYFAIIESVVHIGFEKSFISLKGVNESLLMDIESH